MGEPTAEDRIFNAIEELKGKFEEFKSEFDTRMYKGNGKPAVMSWLKCHEDALQDIHVAIGGVSNKVLREKEDRREDVAEILKLVKPVVEAHESATEGVSFIKKNGKLLISLFILAVIFIIFLGAGAIYINSKLPGLSTLIRKLNGL